MPTAYPPTASTVDDSTSRARSARHDATIAPSTIPRPRQPRPVSDGKSHEYTRAAAAMLDEVLVDRIVGGIERPRRGSWTRKTPELVAAIEILAVRYRMSDAEIGARLGRSRDAVQKLRHRAGIPSGQPCTRAQRPARPPRIERARCAVSSL